MQVKLPCSCTDVTQIQQDKFSPPKEVFKFAIRFHKPPTVTCMQDDMDIEALRYGPWYIDTFDDSLKDPNLCVYCRRINFHWLLNNDLGDAFWDARTAERLARESRGLTGRWIPPDTTRNRHSYPNLTSHGLPFGQLADMISRNGCAFCALATQAAAQLYGRSVSALTEASFVCEVLIGSSTLDDRHRSCATEIEVKFRYPDSVRAPDYVRLIRISDKNVPYLGRKFNTAYIDKNVVSEWLASTDGPSQGLIPPPGFLLVDVQNRQLVQVQTTVKYFALSYVWGGDQVQKTLWSNLEARKVVDGLSVSALPDTLLDAIHLVRSLDERFIWIDSLCIVQDDTTGWKSAQLQSMGAIYSSAHAVIAATHGTNAYAGLPGVTVPRKWTQCKGTVHGFTLAVRRPLHSIEQSAYSERAWTFQERFLGCRSLMCTADSIVLCVGENIWEEDVWGPYSPRMSSWKTVAGHDQYDGGVEPLDPLLIYNASRYARSVSRYSTRVMTNKSDILHAYGGLLDLMQPLFGGPYVHGLPVTELDMALLWMPTSWLRTKKARITDEAWFKRREDNSFPSWSWAGWEGPVSWQGSTGHIPELFSRVCWVNTCDNTTISSTELRGITADHDSHGDWKQISTGQGLYPSSLWYQPPANDLYYLHPLGPAQQRRSLDLSRNGTGLPVKVQMAWFRTVHGQLRPGIGHEHDCKEQCVLDLLDSRGHRAGKVTVVASLMSEVSLEGFHQVIALSRSSQPVYRHDSYPFQIHDPPPDDDRDCATRSGCMPAEDAPQKSTEHILGIDHKHYHWMIPWPIYNILLVKRMDRATRQGPEAVSRLGLGECHVDAFQGASVGWIRLDLV